MSHALGELPLTLGPTFTVATGRAAGVSRRRMRGRDLTAVTTGGRSRGSVDDLVARAAQFAAVVGPTCVFSHRTAARLLGLPTGRPWSPQEPLDLIRDSRYARWERRGVRTHRGLERRAVVETASGLPVTGALDTVRDLSTVLQLGDLVAALDEALALGLLTDSELDRLQSKHAARRGVVRLRQACQLARAGAASPWESKARVVFAECELPEPELNVDVCDDDGVWLARPDFVWRAQRVVAEYDGDHHRTDREQWQRDRERRARLEDAGWHYVEMTALTLTDLDARLALVARLRRVLAH